MPTRNRVGKIPSDIELSNQSAATEPLTLEAEAVEIPDNASLAGIENMPAVVKDLVNEAVAENLENIVSTAITAAISKKLRPELRTLSKAVKANSEAISELQSSEARKTTQPQTNQVVEAFKPSTRIGQEDRKLDRSTITFKAYEGQKADIYTEVDGVKRLKPSVHDVLRAALDVYISYASEGCDPDDIMTAIYSLV